MSNRRTTLFYALLIAIASIAVGMVIASRLDMAPQSAAQELGVPPANKAPFTGPVEANTFRNIAKAVTPAVVNIRTESRQRTQDLNDFFGSDLFERFFGDNQAPRRQAPREQIVEAAGTGFIIDKAGFILTNNHVVEGATTIKVSLFGDDADQEYAAKVVGRDPLSDSALIQLTEKPARDLPEVKFGDSNQMEPGDWVMAIGNPFGLAHTVSVGVVSAVGRPFPVAEQRQQQVIQTDAAINPGNSGGPLLNIRGEVIGINTAIYTGSQQAGNIGIGFAMPINVVRELLPQLRTGKITRGRIGVTIGAIPRGAVEALGLTAPQGALVRSVTPGGAGAKAGIQPGDVIVGYNGKPVKNNDQLVEMVMATRPGTRVPVRVVRDKQERTVTVTVEELDLEAETTQQARGGNRGSGDSQQTHGFGMTLGNITPDVARRLRLDDSVKGAVILDVDDNSPAAAAGLAGGDVILRVNRQPVAGAAEAQRALQQVTSGKTAFLLILRDGQEQFVTITKE